ncbi:MAG: ExeM/NucH family extracellular endonuclease [Cyanobacteria bacterium J06638_22]
MVATDLFFSEYVEGSSFNKALEIYNGTNSTIDLAAEGYTLELYSNGSSTVSQSLTLTGAIAAGDVFVLSNPSADPAILAEADVQNGSVINFNGDDTLVLRKDGVVIDSFGQIGVDPGSSWPGGGANVTLRRQASITAGDTDASDAFDASVEWDSFPNDTFDGLGSFTIDTPTAPSVFINEIQVNTTGDDWEFFELQGAPGTDLSTLTLLVIESDAGTTTGQIDRVISLAGQVIPDDGFWLGISPAAETAYGVTGDFSIADNSFENSTATYLLVEGFTGDQGDDLDTNDDGVLDVTPWTTVADSLTLTDGDAGDVAYSDVVIGPDGPFLPSGTFRTPNAPTGSFSNDNILSFSTPDGTPGVSNVPQPLVINEVLGSTTGADVEYIELFGEAGTSLDGLSIIVVEGDNGSPIGSIDARVDLGSEDVIGENGFFLVGNSLVSGAYSVTPNQDIPANFIENSSYTIALVETSSLSGTAVAGNEVVVDTVGVTDGDAGDTFFFNAPVVGPDGPFLPAGVRRVADGVDTDTAADWAFGDFNLGSDNTPTAGTTSGGGGPTDRFIHEIQGETNLADGMLVGVAGSADESPLLGNSVRVQAIVTAVFPELGGFYIQEEDGDADTNDFTSEGIFIASSNAVNIGDLVTVEGTVAEVEGETRVTASSVAVDSTGNALPTATVVTFPTATVLQDADGDFVANLEAYEGMLVTIPEAMSVTELFQLDRFGTIRVSSEGRLEQFTQSNTPSQAGFEQHLKDIAARSLVIDDGQDVQNPSSILVPDLGSDGTLDNGDVFRMGDTYSGLTGVLSYSEDDQTGSEEPEYRLHTPTGNLTQVNPRPTGPDEVGGTLKVASFNVLNFFTTLDTFPGNEGVGPNGLSPRGADTNPQNARPGTGSLDEYNRQLDKLVESIIGSDSDVIGLVELENDFLKGGDSPNDTDAQDPRDIAIQELVNAVNAKLGADIYDWVRPGDNVEFVGGDAIAVGFIYNTTTVNLVGDAAILDDPSFVDPNGTGQGRNRAALAQTFEEVSSGETFTAVINHFKSKGDSGLAGGTLSNPDVDQLDGQGFWNDTRTDAANVLANWLATDPTGSGDADILILGDLNAYANEDPIQALENQGYTDLAQQFIGDDAYSFVFDGQTGTLDYALANSTLLSQVTGATEWHTNADEPDAFDYNLEFGRDPALLSVDPFRASDHDTVIVGLALDSPNQAPVLVNNSLTVVEGQSVTLTSDDLSATDADNDDATLIFTVSNVQNGSFSTTTFTQQDIIDGLVVFTPDGSENAPAYAVSVSDGEASTPAVAATIDFGTTQNDQIIVGTPGDDVITPTGDESFTVLADDGRDVIVTNSGDDIIVAGGGNDTITTGAGNDIIRYVGSWFEERTDVVTDFAKGLDKIDLAALFPSDTHSSTTPFNDYIRLVETNGNTSVEGNFRGDSQPGFFRELVVLEGVTGLTEADFILDETDPGDPGDPGDPPLSFEIVGNDARNTLVAPDGNNYILQGLGDRDTLIGNTGDDTLIGGAARDILTGGDGSDRFVYESVSDGDDRIQDFEVGSDILDLAALFDNDPNFGATTAQERFDNYLDVRVKGGRTIVRLDVAGDSGTNFQRFATLANAADVTFADFRLV